MKNQVNGEQHETAGRRMPWLTWFKGFSVFFVAVTGFLMGWYAEDGDVFFSVFLLLITVAAITLDLGVSFWVRSTATKPTEVEGEGQADESALEMGPYTLPAYQEVVDRTTARKA